jgi:hypothetical protein
MIDSVKKIHFFTISIFSLMVLVIVFCTGCFLTDNATTLAYQLESISKKLKSQKNGSEVVIHYKAEDAKAPFTILLVPGGLNVYQNGTESNTSYHCRFVDVVTTQTINGIGKRDIVVKKVGVRPGQFTKEVVLVELHSK